MARMTRLRMIVPVLLHLVLLGVFAPPAMALVGYEIPITSTDSNHTWPSISGDLVVYEDDRYGNVDIFLYNLSSGTETRLTDQDCEHYWPKVQGDRVVWWDNRHGKFDIFLYNVSTGIEQRITTDPNQQENADLYGDRIVWMDGRSLNSFDIFLLNTTTGDETQITNDASDQWVPSIWGDHVVWMDNSTNPGYDPSYQFFDMNSYDISTGNWKAITTEGWAWYGGIHGHRFVWSQWIPDNSYDGGYNEQIYLYDFLTGTRTRITSDPSNHWYPKIYGDRIVWEDDRNGADSNWDIFLYNITTGTEEQVTTDPLEQWNPVIWGDRIVYEDYRGGKPQIHLYTIISKPVPEFEANVTEGTAPLAVQFTDGTKGNVTGWLWDFGDSSPTSAEENPTHVYESPGTYTVTLTAMNAAGSGTVSKEGFITVSQGLIPFPGQENIPTDPDGDGKYEDIDGDGEPGFLDVVVLFKYMEWIPGNEPIPPFDMNDSGDIEFTDVVLVFKEL